MLVQLGRSQQRKGIEGRCSRTMCMQRISAWTSRESFQGREGEGGHSLTDTGVHTMSKLPGREREQCVFHCTTVYLKGCQAVG